MESIHRNWNQRWGLGEVRTQHDDAPRASREDMRSFGSMVARDGLEPPTREFSVRSLVQVAPYSYFCVPPMTCERSASEKVMGPRVDRMKEAPEGASCEAS